MTRRRNTGSAPRVLGGDARSRRASQAAAVGQVAGGGMGVDPSGRLESKLGQGFYKDGDGVWQIRVRAPLMLAPGSPRALTINLTQPVAREILATAEPTSDDVKGLDDDATVTATLNRFEAAFLAGDAALQAQIDAYPKLLAAGSGTLRPSDTFEVVVGIDMTEGSLAITLTRATFGSGTGAAAPYADPSEFTATSFFVRSADPLDDADFYWTVTRYA